MRRRLLLSNLSLALIVLLLLEVPLGVFFADRERKQLSADVERDAYVLGSLYEESLEGTVAVDLSAALAYQARTGARVVIVNDQGISVVDTELDPPRDFSTRAEIQQALGGQRAVGTRFSRTLDTDLLYVAVPISSGGVVHGASRLTLPTSAVDARIRRFWLSLAAVGIIVLLVATLLAVSLASTVVRPVRDLTDAADRLAAGDLGARIDTEDAPPELERLAGSFNEMARRLDQLVASQRSFIADASHQLRTPLTALRLQLENAEAETSDAATRSDLAASISETDRLADIVNQLLSLARSEGRRVELEPVDVVATVLDRAELWRVTAEERSVDLIHETPKSSSALCAPGALEQILDNLLDNAIGVTPPEGTVRISVESRPTQTVIRVTDQGPGMDDHSKERAFERFWRGDGDRPGTGLGLPIVRALAEQSGGTVDLEDGPGGGLAAVVSFPAS